MNARSCLENRRRYVGFLEVRRDRVSAWLDGRRVAEWKPAHGVLGFTQDQDKSCGDMRVGSGESTVYIHSIQVLEVTGKGTFTRPDDPAAKEAKKKQDEVWAEREKAGAGQPAEAP